ncbi:MAG: AmmeMemoRadiSam system protein B, partial [Planctomycetota bacterium]
MSTRRAEKAGSWYPSDPRELRALLESCLRPAEAPVPAGEPVAAIVPHAGLAFSGPTAGKSFHALRPARPEALLIFGAVHTMHLAQPAVWPEGSWETPLGAVPVDASLAREVCRSGLALFDERPHHGDNAIELQMPFVRHCFPGVPVVPIAVPPQKEAAALGEEAWEVALRSGKRVLALGSTDLTHYGASFGVMPAGQGRAALDWAGANDQRLI